MSDTSSELDYWGNMNDMDESNSRFNLAYVRLYDERLHGFDNALSDPNVHGQYLCGSVVPLSMWSENPKEISDSYDVVQQELNVNLDSTNGNHTSQIVSEQPGFILPVTDEFVPFVDDDGKSFNHNIVRNAYEPAMLKKMQGRLHIVELEYLTGGETVCILHTHALAAFQRRCRNYLARMRDVRAHCGRPSSLMHREMTGAFPAMPNRS